MVVPIEGSRPFAVAYKRGLATMRRREVSRLYIDRVIPHRDDSPTVLPVLYGFTDGARFVFFSADPARNRDDRLTFLRKPGDFGLCRRSSSDSTGIDLSFRPVSGRNVHWSSFYSRAHLSSDERFKRRAVGPHWSYGGCPGR